jgi:hypothetical protein
MKSKIRKHRDGRVSLLNEHGRPSMVFPNLKTYQEWEAASEAERWNWAMMIASPCSLDDGARLPGGAIWDAATHTALCPAGHSLLER